MLANKHIKNAYNDTSNCSHFIQLSLLMDHLHYNLIDWVQKTANNESIAAFLF